MALGDKVSLAPAAGDALTRVLALACQVSPNVMKANNAPTRVLRNLTMPPTYLNSPLSSHFFRLLSTAPRVGQTERGRSMPTYQYACSACLHEFEIFQAFSDSSLTHCPECTGQLRKVYSAVGVVFKGSGFYKTDSKSPTQGAIPPAKDAPAKKSEKSESAPSATTASSTAPTASSTGTKSGD